MWNESWWWINHGCGVGFIEQQTLAAHGNEGITEYGCTLGPYSLLNLPSWSGRAETFEWVRERDIRFKFWLLT
jgi:hypothetical protein